MDYDIALHAVGAHDANTFLGWPTPNLGSVDRGGFPPQIRTNKNKPPTLEVELDRLEQGRACTGTGTRQLRSSRSGRYTQT